jgi:hypothetical protein
MEIAVLSGEPESDPRAWYVALQVAHSGAAGLGPVARGSGASLVRRVRLVARGGGSLGSLGSGGSGRPPAPRLGRPSLARATRLGAELLDAACPQTEEEWERAAMAAARASRLVVVVAGARAPALLPALAAALAPGTTAVVLLPGPALQAAVADAFAARSAAGEVALLLGCCCWAAAELGDAVVLTSWGMTLLERLPLALASGKLPAEAASAPPAASHARSFSLALQALEGGLSLTPVLFRGGGAQRQRWAFGALVWRLMDAYAALLALPAPRPPQQPQASLSLYELLLVAEHRVMMAKLVEEALVALGAKEQGRVLRAGGPLLGLLSPIDLLPPALSGLLLQWLLRLPDPLFRPALALLAALSMLGSPAALDGGPHAAGAAGRWALRQAEMTNGIVVSRAQCAGFAAPANARVLARAAACLAHADQKGAPAPEPEEGWWTAQDWRACETRPVLPLASALSGLLLLLASLALPLWLLRAAYLVALW